MTQAITKATGRTAGPWFAEMRQCEPSRGHIVQYVSAASAAGIIAQCWRPAGDTHDNAELQANARFIAAAGTAAHECEQLGYDGEACVRALPELLDFAAECARADSDCGEGIRAAARAAIAKARGGQ